MKSAKNENSDNDNIDVESTNLSLVSRTNRKPRRRYEKTSSREESGNNSLSLSHQRANSTPPSGTEKTEVLSPSSSSSSSFLSSLPGAVAIVGLQGSEEVVDVDADVEAGENSHEIVVSSDDLPEDQDLSSVVRKQEPTVMETMVHAELVTPPVEALRVSIDEEYDDPSQYQPRYGCDNSQTSSEDQEHSSFKSKGIFQRKWGCLHWTILVLLLLLIVCAILLPIAFVHTRQEVHTFPYQCFRTTREMLEAQVSPDSALMANLVLIMCPGTRVNVGEYSDVENSDLRFVRGDYPLTVVRENVTIQCGLDGKSENDCIINGGPKQVSTSENVTHPDGTIWSLTNPVDHMIIRGMTFTGEIRHEGVSVSLSHLGQNIRFEDCRWMDMTARRGLIRVQENAHSGEMILIAGDMESSKVAEKKKNIQATFSNCIFQNILYDGPFMYVVNQKLEVQNSLFKDIRPSNNARNECLHIYSPEEGELRYSEGCASLLSCSPHGDCSLSDSCVENMGYKGPGLVVAHEGSYEGSLDRTEFHHERLYLEPSSVEPCELARILDFDSSAPNCYKIFEETACRIPSYL